MKTHALEWTPHERLNNQNSCYNSDIIIFFGPRAMLGEPALLDDLRAASPRAVLIGCSTGGQIAGPDVSDDRVCGIALHFERTALRLARTRRDAHATSLDAGRALGEQLAAPDLAGVFLLADGLQFNGSELVAGLTDVVGSHVPLHGGLAGDGADFVETTVVANGPAQSGIVAAVGFYGDRVRLGCGSAGGWEVFGPRRRITRAVDNVVYELDGKPALDLYERYLGEEAADLPGSGLLYPLRIFDPANPDHDIVRTLLAIDRQARSITFAGSMPEGWTAQLMRGSLDRLTDGAARAAAQAVLPEGWTGDGAAFLVSCIGRRLLMGQRAQEEVEAVRSVFRNNLPMLGFYSYGEISPHAVTGFSELHNQTMTVMTIAEDAA